MYLASRHGHGVFHATDRHRRGAVGGRAVAELALAGRDVSSCLTLTGHFLLTAPGTPTPPTPRWPLAHTQSR
jgi:hypothetical protein